MGGGGGLKMKTVHIIYQDLSIFVFLKQRQNLKMSASKFLAAF